MRFPLQRFYQDERQTLGTLKVGAVTMFTIERPWLGNQPNVSRIPEGRYMFGLEAVEDRQVIRLKTGGGIYGERTLINIEVANYARELEGCIGLGLGVSVHGDVRNGAYMTTKSADAYAILLEMLEELDPKVDCWLKIDDPSDL